MKKIFFIIALIIINYYSAFAQNNLYLLFDEIDSKQKMEGTINCKNSAGQVMQCPMLFIYEYNIFGRGYYSDINRTIKGSYLQLAFVSRVEKNINELPQNIKNIGQLEQELSQLTQRQNMEYWESFDKIYLIQKLPNTTSFYLIMVGLR
jgi:hypothetical protein